MSTLFIVSPGVHGDNSNAYKYRGGSSCIAIGMSVCKVFKIIEKHDLAVLANLICYTMMYFYGPTQSCLKNHIGVTRSCSVTSVFSF